MRERLAAAFFLFAVLVLVVAGLVRAWAVGDLLRGQEMAILREEARLVAAVIEDQRASGGQVDRELLDGLARVDDQVTYTAPDGQLVMITGPEFREEGALTAKVDADGGTVVLSTGTANVSALFSRQLTALVGLVLLVSLLAGVAGWWAARWLAAPFRSLAEAAAALGRGRFDVDLPRTRIPEVRAIGQALRVSAAQLEGRLSRERDFVEFASHELRTPLTSLRLELEDLALRSDVPGDVKEAAVRCIEQVDLVNNATDEVVALSREGTLVEGGQVRIGELATQVTQDWSDRLAPTGRAVTARAEGEIDLYLTPGPVEQILDAVLDDVVRGEGPVQLLFQGSHTHVRIVVPAGSAGTGPVRGLEVARGLALPQGGRLGGDLVQSDLDLWMPRR